MNFKVPRHFLVILGTDSRGFGFDRLSGTRLDDTAMTFTNTESQKVKILKL